MWSESYTIQLFSTGVIKQVCEEKHSKSAAAHDKTFLVESDHTHRHSMVARSAIIRVVEDTTEAD
jgi:hypothetical protein